jgi:L-alanine-DL-glutamate epimerase-like enolase superfamily enzyme
MARAAQSYTHANSLKLKLTGEAIDAERVRAVRSARPDAWISVDANQGHTRRSLEQLIPLLVDMQVSLIEQPLLAGSDEQLDGLNAPIEIAADESVQSLSDLPRLAGRFQVINIKLDKCGGLTEGLSMARAARELGMKSWVGNMFGTSLAMAPAYLLGQICNFVELDGPIFLSADRTPAVHYENGLVSCPEALWGYPREL